MSLPYELGRRNRIVPITVISRLIGFRNSHLDRLLRAAFDSTEMVGVTLSRQRLLGGITGILSTTNSPSPKSVNRNFHFQSFARSLPTPGSLSNGMFELGFESKGLSTAPQRPVLSALA